MLKAIKSYIRTIDATSRFVGKIAMYLIFVMIAILLYDTIMRTVFNSPNIWAVELTQFVMAAYWTLGGAFTLLIGGHVRMDVLYAHWTPRGKAFIDALTFTILLAYMIILLIGGFQGIKYAFVYKQITYSAWAPKVLPIKLIMVGGMILMLLQILSEFFKDLLTIRGEDVREEENKGEEEKARKSKDGAATEEGAL